MRLCGTAPFTLRIICLIAASVVCAADVQEKDRNWHPNTRILDESAKHADPVTKDAGSTLAHDLKRFYQLLRDKQWHETYKLRARAFRHDVPESIYLEEAKKAEKLWGLVNYEVLSGEFQNSYGSTNIDEAALICKFTELPDYAVSYSTVYWHKENGVWKCLSAGPFKLSIFRATRPPFIDWR
jgi:hypothetical protein